MNILHFLKADLFPIFKTFVPESTPQSMRLIVADVRQEGDYQLNGFVACAALNKAPGQRERLIAQFLNALTAKNFPWLAKVSRSLSGFINFTLSEPWLYAQLFQLEKPLAFSSHRERVVIDYSAPNIAKEMAVHHMRSTFIGDAMSRILEALGHKVIRANHVGDWGTQFGLLLAWIKDNHIALDDCSLSDLETYYCQAQLKKSDDAAFSERARSAVVALQQGEHETLLQWQKLVDLSMARNYEIYARLNVKLSATDTFGESAYNAQLPALIHDLLKKNIAVKENDMVVVFSTQFKNKDQAPMAIILQKSGGGFLYATTDLAAITYRVNILKADRIIYCVDGRQAQHFELVWEVARRAGYLPSSVKVEHHAFGMMLGADGRPYKTRSGATPKLMELVEQAHQEAEKVLHQRGVDRAMSVEDHDILVHALAVNSIKYADLMRHRTTHYKFSWKEALSLEGNTAPYLMYALVRAQSILRRAMKSNADKVPLFPAEEMEWDPLSRTLLMACMRWQEIVEKAAEEGTPHLLCQHLYHLALSFSSFYEVHSVLGEENPSKFNIKRLLTERMAQILAFGLDLLGLIPVQQM